MQSLRGLYAPFQRGIAAYNSYLQKNYPTVYELQNAVLHGSKTTMVDGKDYVIAAGRNMQEKPLSYRELTLRWTYPGDLLKLSPVLLFLMLPFSTVALVPVIYYFPKQLFTRSFWTSGQRQRFDAEEITKRYEAVPGVIAHFEQTIPRSQTSDDRYLLQDVLHRMKKSHVVPKEQILSLRPIFAQHPFSFFSLSPEYLNDLARLNGMSARKVQKFPHHLVLMDHALDEKLRKGKGDLTEQQIRDAALLRGFDPNLSLDDCIKFLTNWTHASSALSGPAESLLLHFPVFLSYPYVFNREGRPHVQSK